MVENIYAYTLCIPMFSSVHIYNHFIFIFFCNLNVLLCCQYIMQQAMVCLMCTHNTYGRKCFTVGGVGPEKVLGFFPSPSSPSTSLLYCYTEPGVNNVTLTGCICSRCLRLENVWYKFSLWMLPNVYSTLKLYLDTLILCMQRQQWLFSRLTCCVLLGKQAFACYYWFIVIITA